MKTSFWTLPTISVTLEGVPHHPAELKYSLRPKYSVDAAIYVCKMPSAPAADGKDEAVCLSAVKICECLPFVSHWHLICIAEHGDHRGYCRADNRHLSFASVAGTADRSSTYMVIVRGLTRFLSGMGPTLLRPPYLKEPPGRIAGQVFFVLSYKTYRCRESDLMFT